ncbi:hypothetical protein EDB87DRAFT_1627678 [Lactarius vividus]|nr:hypothetical protein EDB87DRAFT_1627678 [Lactarius vividus]
MGPETRFLVGNTFLILYLLKVLSSFIQPPSSCLILCLYAKSFARRDILIGKYKIPVESQISSSSIWNLNHLTGWTSRL